MEWKPSPEKRRIESATARVERRGEEFIVLRRIRLAFVACE
jgi:hypothetical protein